MLLVAIVNGGVVGMVVLVGSVEGVQVHAVHVSDQVGTARVV